MLKADKRTDFVPKTDRLAPNKRSPDRNSGGTLPAGTIVVSADSHLTVGEDIYYPRFPKRLKDRAPRVWKEGGICHIGFDGKSVVPEILRPLISEQDIVPGSHDIAARVEDLRQEGIAKEVAFPTVILALFNYPDYEVRGAAFRAYNEYLAELQSRAPGVFYGVGIANQWEPLEARKSIAEMKAMGLKTFMIPINPGKFPDGRDIHYSNDEMRPFWEAVEESGLPICFHIGESFQLGPRGMFGIKMIQEFSGFRKTVGELIFGGVLDRHPSLRVVFAEAGINWMPSARQDAEMLLSSYRRLMDWPLKNPIEHYFRNNFYASFMVDDLGLSMLDEIGPDRVMWSVDYPHAEGTFGFSRSAIQQVVAATTEDNARRILGGTAIEIFDLA